MESFDIINPTALLSPYVKHYWFLESRDVSGVAERTIPTGTIHLIFHKGSRMYSSLEKEWQPRSFICGQTTDYRDLTSTGNVNMIAVVFYPHTANAFFSIPMDEFYKLSVSTADLSDPELNELEKQLIDSEDKIHSVRLIESFLIKRLYGVADTCNYKRIGAVVNEISRQGPSDMLSLARIACLSYKQFNRVFTRYVGANPKEFSRIVRFQRALYVLQTQQLSFTETAYACGFADQSHLVKEFRQLSGYTPSEYLSVCNPYSDYFSAT